MPTPPRPSAVTGNSLSLHSQLAALVRRKPVTASPETPLREALQLMSENRVGSIIVIEPESGRPIGIFTLRDLLHRVAAKTCDVEQWLASVMSDSGLAMLNWRSTVYQAALLMARRGVHHVIIVDAAGRLAGVVSQEDIYELQRGGVKAISGAIRNSRDMEGLIAAADEIRRMTMQMLSDGSSAEALIQLISTLNDHLTVRIIELTSNEFALPKVHWCWLAFGSEGRFEQTFSTDQDNGIIFEAPDDDAGTAEVLRHAFLPFAQAVNRKLDACGFTLCKGNIMAGNPELCLSLTEWRDKFSSWLHAADPQALLNASIFFDLRPIFGADSLAEELRDWLLARTGTASLFLRFMAGNAVQAAPPLGIIRDFVFDKNPNFPHTIDLKAFGSRPFVDAARIFALANGISHTSTVQRLRAVAERMEFARDDVAAMVEGFHFIQQLRLRHQQVDGTMAASANRINPDQLNELHRHVLKGAFRQAGKLQQRLQLDYRL
ncbi:MAG: CBS domain-containing protein [Rhodocyclaceae bacterium]|nr:MAG: CBS domain-containing protein [Rhodocyclaceae bacterium]